MGGGLPGLGGPTAPQVPLDQLLAGLVTAPPAVTAPQVFSGGDPNTSMQIANQVTQPPGPPGPPTGPTMQAGGPAPGAPAAPQAPGAPLPPQASMPDHMQPSRFTFGAHQLQPALAGLGAKQFTPPIQPTPFGM